MKVYLISTGKSEYDNYEVVAIVPDKAEADAIVAEIKQLEPWGDVQVEEFDMEIMRKPWWIVGWKNGQLIAEQVEHNADILLQLDRPQAFGHHDHGFDYASYYAYIVADTAEAAVSRFVNHTLDDWDLPTEMGRGYPEMMKQE